MDKAFRNPPLFSFLTLLIGPLLLIFGLAWYFTGTLILSPDFQTLSKTSTTIVTPRILVTGGPMEVVRPHLVQTLGFWEDRPSYCSGTPPNEFQREQCGVLDRKILWGAFYGVIPFLAFFGAGWLAVSFFQGVYRRFQRAWDKGEAKFVGVVQNPKLLAPSAFGRIFGFRFVRILPAKEQPKGAVIPPGIVRKLAPALRDAKLLPKIDLVVLWPNDLDLPRTDSRVAVISGGRVMGEVRYLGRSYQPNMVVLSSST